VIERSNIPPILVSQSRWDNIEAISKESAVSRRFISWRVVFVGLVTARLTVPVNPVGYESCKLAIYLVFTRSVYYTVLYYTIHYILYRE
jgi:hypothetical protein